MNRDKYKDKFADTVAAAFRAIYPQVYQSTGHSAVFSRESVYESLERPRDPRMGRFAMPLFRHVRLLNDKPPEIAAKVADEVNRLLLSEPNGTLVTCQAAGGYLNARVDPHTLASETVRAILSEGASFGSETIGEGKTILVEYSSPNIAKPFGIGHLRTTILGNSLRRIFKKLGYKVVGINYPGDWGTQFGKMIVAFRKWGSEKLLAKDAVKNLLKLYVRFHREVESNPGLDDEARLAFKQLEQGEPEALALWKKFKEISQAEFDRVYSALDIEFDLVIAESFFNDKMDAVIERLERAGLTKLSRGALIVETDDPNLPPALLRKQDGATLYITRDLAGLVYRWQEFNFEESLYVVGSAQAVHFKQCLEVIRKMEESENLPPRQRMTGRVKHIEFGWVRFDGKAMATRQGNIVLLDDVIAEASRRALDKIKEKTPDLENIADVAHMIGVGAIIFSQMSVRRHKDINFIWDDVLNFEGETGPYLQYTHARLCSLLRNADADISSDVDYTLLAAEEEQRIIEALADFSEVILNVMRQYDPYFIAAYLFRLTSAFNSMYQRKRSDGRIDKIISDDPELTATRLALVKGVQIVLKEGLYLLGLKAPEKM